MTTLICIVEGEGEVQAVRPLIEKLVDWNRETVTIAQPKNAHGRRNLLKENGLEKFLELARREAECDGVLVLVDADDDCAAELAQSLAERARPLRLPFPVSVVCAKCEYEAWFLASLESIRGSYDIPQDVEYEGEVEERRGVKEWLSSQMPGGTIYKETYHQVRMTALLDPERARARSRSFRRLEHAVRELLDGDISVSPR